MANLSAVIYQLDDDIWFPPHEEAVHDILAVGGDLSTERLITAYANGIFPWYDDTDEILWWSPKDRCVLFLDELHISKSMRNVLNRHPFKVTVDEAFKEVMEGCRSGDREGKTWIHNEVVEAYVHLHELGLAHSVEVWNEGRLVGGLYGVSLGQLFFGESMFSRESNASKVALIHLVNHLKAKGWKMIDCQIYNEHLGSLGARNIPRENFLEILSVELKYPTVGGKWKFQI
ncbi:MAG: leucyl/phenylalanyl-tRNA--protein transferase [Flavobacteriales bacterium]